MATSGGATWVRAERPGTCVGPSRSPTPTPPSLPALRSERGRIGCDEGLAPQICGLWRRNQAPALFPKSGASGSWGKGFWTPRHTACSGPPGVAGQCRRESERTSMGLPGATPGLKELPGEFGRGAWWVGVGESAQAPELRGGEGRGAGAARRGAASPCVLSWPPA